MHRIDQTVRAFATIHFSCQSTALARRKTTHYLWSWFAKCGKTTACLVSTWQRARLFRFLRLPRPDQAEEIDSYRNATGLSWQVMLDLQKVMVCADMYVLEKEQTAVDRKYVAHVASLETFSKKITDAIGSQPAWRQDGWASVLVCAGKWFFVLACVCSPPMTASFPALAPGWAQQLYSMGTSK